MKGFDYFKLALSKYAEFEGRSRRSEYWYFALFNVLINFVVALVDSILGTSLLGIVASLALVVPGIAVAVRRLHDVGKSGWHLLLILLPIIGWILLLVWYVTDSQPGSNKWGSNPKEEGSEIHDHLVEDSELV